MWGDGGQPVRHRRAFFEISVSRLSGLAPLSWRELPGDRPRQPRPHYSCRLSRDADHPVSGWDVPRTRLTATGGGTGASLLRHVQPPGLSRSRVGVSLGVKHHL